MKGCTLLISRAAKQFYFTTMWLCCIVVLCPYQIIPQPLQILLRLHGLRPWSHMGAWIPMGTEQLPFLLFAGVQCCSAQPYAVTEKSCQIVQVFTRPIITDPVLSSFPKPFLSLFFFLWSTHVTRSPSGLAARSPVCCMLVWVLRVFNGPWLAHLLTTFLTWLQAPQSPLPLHPCPALLVSALIACLSPTGQAPCPISSGRVGPGGGCSLEPIAPLANILLDVLAQESTTKVRLAAQPTPQ